MRNATYKRFSDTCNLPRMLFQSLGLLYLYLHSALIHNQDSKKNIALYMCAVTRHWFGVLKILILCLGFPKPTLTPMTLETTTNVHEYIRS